ncbi:lipid A deacylase LpxR family protein [Tenacibaculum xiamenense]|uniref:lipid A deacylase LpxR family protein n=1 Tax=Tenacibaculum xiamenense TaxID=1261553 RepID=UPI003893FC00
MKNFKAFLFLIFPILCFSQKQYSKEFSFINDNDLYISLSQDRYYTNGMFFNYRFISKHSNQKIAKKIIDFEIGHKIYTPFKAVVQSPQQHDRPFAGYLYGSFGINHFFKNNSFLKNSVEIGVIGPGSMAEELQNFIHDIYGFRRAIGWKYQIRNAFALNFKSSYGKTIIGDTSKYFDVTWTSTANFGTVLTNISTGFYSRLGLKPLQKIINTIAFNSNLNKKDSDLFNKKEAFIYLKPQIGYVLYDATIQGSFLNTTSPITYSAMPFVFTTELGIRFTVDRLNLGYTINYHSKKLKSLQVPRGNFFGTIQINYQFE